MKNKARAARLRRKMRARALRQAAEARRIVEQGVDTPLLSMEIGMVESVRFIESTSFDALKTK